MDAGPLYDLLAPVYAKLIAPMHELATTRVIERVLGGAPTTVLEVAVGPGHAMAQLGKTKRRVVGIDLSGSMLKRAATLLNAEHATAHLARANAVRLPFGSGTFDAVMTTFLLDLLPESDVGNAMQEMARVLSPGGRLVIGTMELPNALFERAWMTTYRVLPDLVGRCRPIDLDPHLAALPLRGIREELVPGWLGVRVLTMIKVGG